MSRREKIGSFSVNKVGEVENFKPKFTNLERGYFVGAVACGRCGETIEECELWRSKHERVVVQKLLKRAWLHAGNEHRKV